MKIIYLVLAIWATIQLTSIAGAFGVIAQAYVIWAKSVEKDANPLIKVERGEDEDKFTIQ